ESLVRIETLQNMMVVDDDGRLLKGKTPTDRARADAMFQQMKQILTEFTAIQKRLAGVNHEFLPRIVAAMPAEAAERFKDEHDSKAWTFVYPDRTDPQKLYLSILHADGLSQDLRSTIEKQWSE